MLLSPLLIFPSAGKDAIKEVKVGGLDTTLTDLETFTSYYLKIAAFTKVTNILHWSKALPGLTVETDRRTKQSVVVSLFASTRKEIHG